MRPRTSSTSPLRPFQRPHLLVLSLSLSLSLLFLFSTRRSPLPVALSSSLSRSRSPRLALFVVVRCRCRRHRRRPVSVRVSSTSASTCSSSSWSSRSPRLLASVVLAFCAFVVRSFCVPVSVSFFDARMGASDSRLSLRQAVFRLYEEKVGSHYAYLRARGPPPSRSGTT